MADLVVGMARSVVGGVLATAQAAMEDDEKLRQSVQRNLVFITGEFEMMQSFLNVADGERLDNPVVGTWVRQILDLAYDVEDCIEFVIHLDKKKRWWIRLLKPLSWLTPCVNVKLQLDEAIDELVCLKARVQDVSSRNTRYSLISDSGSKTATVALPASRDTVAVGNTPFDRIIEAAYTNEQVTHLLPEKDHDLRVVSIWGTGGGDVGMASITWNAFIHQETPQSFVCRAWVKMMHPFHPHEFVRSVMAQFYANSCKKERVLMKTMEATPGPGGDPLEDFEQLLMKKRYLLVLEDLSTMAEWAAISKFFPSMKNGSCVILSTQQLEVAILSVGRPYQVLHLDQLPVEHSVYAFFTKGSLDDGDEGMEINNELSSSNVKKEAAHRWIEGHPLVGRELDMQDLSRNVILTWAKGYQVMSVWGLSGVGKSVLIKNMFCHKIVHGKQFQKYGWVDVSHPFSLWDFSQILLTNLGCAYIEANETAIDLCRQKSDCRVS